jgi:hypothetical protein
VSASSSVRAAAPAAIPRQRDMIAGIYARKNTDQNVGDEVIR